MFKALYCLYSPIIDTNNLYICLFLLIIFIAFVSLNAMAVKFPCAR